jgi:O-antigen ligase/Flp pilus assembly protein TadD
VNARRPATVRPSAAPNAPWARRMVILLCAVMPVVWNPWGFQQRLPVAWLIVVVAVPLGLAAVVRRAPIVWHPAAWWFTSFLVAMALATAVGIAPLTSLIGESNRYLGLIGWTVLGLAFVLGLQVGHDQRARAVIRRSVTVGAFGVSALGLIEKGERLFGAGANLQQSRATSSFRNAAFLGSYLVLVIPVAVSVMIDKNEDRRWRIAAGLASVASLATLLATQTRAAWLGTLAAFVTMGWLTWRRGSRRSAALGALVAALAVGVAIGVAPLRDRAFSIGRTGGGSNGVRARLWARSAALVAKRPLTGYGPDALGIAFPTVIDDAYEIEVTRATAPDRAHNLELDLLLWGGIGALITAAGFIVTVVRSSSPTRVGGETVALAGALVGYLVQLQMSFSLADVDVMALLFAGVLVSASRPNFAEARDQAVLRRLAAGVLAVLSFGLGIWHVRAVIADRSLRQAVAAENSGDIERARQLYVSAAASAPERTHLQQALARFYLRTQQGDLAVTTIDRALDVAPQQESYLLDRASGLALAGKKAEAIRQLDVVLARDPSSADAWLIRGTLAGQLQDPSAATALRRAQVLAPWSPVPVEQIGLLAEANGDRNGAIVAFTEALAIDPDSTVAQQHLATLR